MHALIETDTLTDRGKRRDFGADPIPDLSHKTTPLKWVSVIGRGARPAHDPATHHAPVPAADVVTTDDLTESWAAAVALTAQEITDRDDAIYNDLVTEADAPLVDGAEGVRFRALVELFNKRDNYLVNRISELQDALVALQGSGGNAGTRLDALPASYLATSTRTKAAAISDYKADIEAGNQNS